MFSKIRYSIGESKLMKRSARLKRNKKVHTFDSCKSAGIIFDANSYEDFLLVKEFMKDLSNKKIQSDLFGFKNEREIPSNLLMWDNCHFICKKDLDIFYRPKAELTNKFLSKKFDILFDLTLKDIFTLRYITTLSNADFKIGRFSEGINDLDMMIDIKKEPLNYLIEQIKVYVEMLNNSNSNT